MTIYQMIEELKNKMWMGTSTDPAWTYEELKAEVRRLESLLYGVK